MLAMRAVSRGMGDKGLKVQKVTFKVIQEHWHWCIRWAA